MSRSRYTKKERKEKTEEAKAKLRAILHSEVAPGVLGLGVIYTEVTHVARSGMSRDVRCLVADASGSIEDVTFWVAHAIGELPREDKRGGRCIRVGGCGFNVGLQVADSLNRALYGAQAVLQQGNYTHKDRPAPSLIWREL